LHNSTTKRKWEVYSGAYRNGKKQVETKPEIKLGFTQVQI